MIKNLQNIGHSTRLPLSTDVVVVGAGIVGVSTALCLAERGVSVVLCEKGTIAAEQSSRNWGWCRLMGRKPSELPLGFASLQAWRAMEERIEADIGYRHSGSLYLAESEAELKGLAEWLPYGSEYGVGTKLLRRQDIQSHLRGAAVEFSGGLFTPTDGRAEPLLATPAMARAARRHGAALIERCAVRSVDIQAGRIAGVVTEQGRIRCNAVVLAGGAWSRLFCGNLGINLPQLNLLGAAMRTEPMAGPTDCMVGAGTFSFSKRPDGGYTLARRNGNLAYIVPDSLRLISEFYPTLLASWKEFRLRIGRSFLSELTTPRSWREDQQTPFERMRILDPKPPQSVLEDGFNALKQAFPVFKDARIAERWAGVIDVTPDAVPVISRVVTMPNFFIATGFSGHGFGLGPGAGALMADLVMNKTPIVDPTPYRLSRFASASKH